MNQFSIVPEVFSDHWCILHCGVGLYLEDCNLQHKNKMKMMCIFLGDPSCCLTCRVSYSRGVISFTLLWKWRTRNWPLWMICTVLRCQDLGSATKILFVKWLHGLSSHLSVSFEINTENINIYKLKYYQRLGQYGRQSLVKIMAWHRTGDKPLSEPKMANFADDIFNCIFERFLILIVIPVKSVVENKSVLVMVWCRRDEKPLPGLKWLNFMVQPIFARIKFTTDNNFPWNSRLHRK